MASRLELQTKLEELLGSRNVYYQAPETLKMSYPCIRYSRNDINNKHADNVKYSSMNQYQIIVISKKPDHEVIQKILDLPYSSFASHYAKDNLNHDVINLYY
jgi:hypothetical protein